MQQVTASQFLKIAALCISLAGCPNDKFERKFFFENPAATRIDRLRQYPLEEQYRIFRYGNDEIHPPLIGLAKPIAERGGDAVSFLLGQIKPPADDIAIRDVLQVFETMESIKSYDVKSDEVVMEALRTRVAAMKDAGWKDVCKGMLERIEAH